jgi:uncharacterized membrane protein YdjX (TVP38/TMEM64 family)
MKPWVWIPVALVAATAVIHLITHIPIGEMDLMRVEAAFQDFGLWSYLLFLAAFVLLAMFPLPSTFWVLLGGSLFGPVLGTLLSVTGATVAAVLAFTVGRYLGRDYLRRTAGPRLQRVMHGVEAEGWRFVAMTRLIPVFPFAPTNYVLGLTGIRLRTYALTTGIALIPNLAAYAWLGSASRQAIAGAQNLAELWLIGLALVALLLFLPGFVRRMNESVSSERTSA